MGERGEEQQLDDRGEKASFREPLSHDAIYDGRSLNERASPKLRPRPFSRFDPRLFFTAGQMVLMISLPQSTHSILNVMALFWLFHTRKGERKGDEDRECKGGNEEIIRFRS